ncbi:hypothetical protein [Acinetobacter calcoaceticus]|uniref:hypothetical protein n=1 Tax=Acinetobacter calcoaceticus TaxID=471 RepID=UPI0019020073|nr:hypothetical protein [Acinetobacter calcoaceticus]MBJ9705500.1 hypothetical protein [Acinetobacter calcoaceticus]
MNYSLFENYKMSLNNIEELKEVFSTQEVNHLLKRGWVLLSIREAKEKNVYVVGLDKWKKFDADQPVDQEAWNEFFPKNPKQE